MSYSMVPMRRDEKDGKNVWKTVFRPEETEYYQFDAAAWQNLAREPARNPAYRPDLDLDLSSRNMYLVVEALGFHMTNEGVVLEIGEFLAATTRWLTRHLESPSAAIPHIELAGSGARMIEFGMHEGYMNEKIAKCAYIALEGRKRGATHVCIS